MKNTFLYLLTFFVVVNTTLYSCMNFENSMTVSIYSSTISQSIQNKVFIDSFKLISYADSREINFNLINCWCEEGWKRENDFLSIKNTKMPFTNFFIKMDNDSFKILFKRKEEMDWQSANRIIEPDLGYYLQVDNYKPTDTIQVRVSNRNTICDYVLMPRKH